MYSTSRFSLRSCRQNGRSIMRVGLLRRNTSKASQKVLGSLLFTSLSGTLTRRIKSVPTTGAQSLSLNTFPTVFTPKQLRKRLSKNIVCLKNKQWWFKKCFGAAADPAPAYPESAVVLESAEADESLPSDIVEESCGSLDSSVDQGHTALSELEPNDDDEHPKLRIHSFRQKRMLKNHRLSWSATRSFGGTITSIIRLFLVCWCFGWVVKRN